VKINEVYDDPDEEHGDADDEWIELYNACDHVVDLKNWYLKDNHGEEVILQTYPIDPGQFVIIAANASTWSHWPLIPANAVKIALGGSSMFNHLNNDGDRVFLYDNNDNEIDAVSWGDDTSAFTPSVSNVPKGNSIAREPKGYDTDTASDWVELDPPNPGTNPHSSSSEEEPQDEEPPTDETPPTLSTSLDTTPSTENENPPGDSGSDSTPGDSSGESSEEENNEDQEGSDSSGETGDETGNAENTNEEGTSEEGEEPSGDEEEGQKTGTGEGEDSGEGTEEEGDEEETPPEPENNDPPPPEE